MKIALDVDGVLADVIQTWLYYNNNMRTTITKSEITEWDFWKKFNINKYDFYRELSTCWKSWNEIPPTESMLSSVTKKLLKLGTVDVVTARERQTDHYVRSWLKSQNIDYKNYVSVVSGPQKAELDYDVYIDDSPINAKKIADSGKKMLLYSQPWNLNLDDSRVSRIYKLADAIEKINEINKF